MKLSKEFHLRAVDKGFYGERHRVAHYLMLAFGELHEGIEADRIGKWAKLTPEQTEDLRGLEGSAYAQAFLRLVKDTVEDEIADAVIRLLDMFGMIFSVHPPCRNFGERVTGEYDERTPPEMLTEALLPIVTETSGLVNLSCPQTGILYAIKSLEQLCDHLGIDLMTHIELKMKYNETRPALHGKKY